MARKRPHHGNRRRGNPYGMRKKAQALLNGTIRIARPGVATVETP
jgi:hypothetical protein